MRKHELVNMLVAAERAQATAEEKAKNMRARLAEQGHDFSRLKEQHTILLRRLSEAQEERDLARNELRRSVSGD